MIDMNRTLGELLSDPRIREIAPFSIAHMDIPSTDMWNKTLNRLREEHFGGGLARGFERLFAAADSGDWFFPLYTEAERAEDPAKNDASLVWFPSGDPAASERPFILLAPGGGFVNVWNLTEGWPVAAQFNDLGYHVFILTYRVTGDERILDKEMEDFARALRFIQDREERFCVWGDEYITCGFSAGGYLVCLWNVPEKGFAAFGLPKPRAVFPVYPLVSWKLALQDDDEEPTEEDLKEDRRLFGFSMEKALKSPFEIPDHAGEFPPCALFLTAGDELVNPEQSRLMARTLEKLGIPCRLEIGPTGGHGFADGSDMCMEGWTGRAVRWYEEIAASAEKA